MSMTTPTRDRLADSSPSRTVPSSTGSGLARNPSLRSARPIRKTANRASIAGDMAEEDAKAANAQIIADLKEQVERAEQASEQYRRQLDAMQQRFDEATDDTTTAEEREFSLRTQIDKLQAELKEHARQNRELEMSYDSEKQLLLKDRDRQITKEAELQSVINRLTESLKFKNQQLNSNTRKEPNDERIDKEHQESAESSQHDYFQVLQEKNNTIETLRLEIADFHLKRAEQEHMGNGRSQELEKHLLDIKMQNARLQEENESFQMLLSEKTLKGDFMHEQPATEGALSSLAEELESVNESDITPEAFRKLEAENKALTLYVDKIIGRLLQHEGFEHIITDKDDAPAPPSKSGSVNKALPDVPSNQTGSSVEPAIASATASVAGFLQRARSVVSRPAAPKVRPVSYIPPVSATIENPETAPSIPLNRGHRRARSDQASDVGAAALLQQSNRGSPLRTVSGSGMSPGISPMSPSATNRASYFAPSSTNTSRLPSGTTTSARIESSSNSVVSEHSLEMEAGSTDASSARASVHGPPGAGLPGAVMKQNQLRPLRLVQEQAQVEEEQKKANRGSWMGWFNKGNTEPAPEQLQK